MALSKPLAGVALVCVTSFAFAADPPGSAATSANGNHPPATQAVVVEGFGQAVSAGTLQRESGSGLVQSNQTITGTVSGNTASQLSTGSNSITGDSFSGSTGLPSVVQNTGNNVLIQTGVIVNVQLKP